MGNKNKLYNAGHSVDVDMVANIVAVFETVINSGTVEDLNAAYSWYPLANVWCAQHAQAFGIQTFQMCGIVAALSPQLNWNKNKEQALLLCAKIATGQPLVGLMAYPANIAKAQRIYNGENPSVVLGGMKVISFYNNLLLNEDYVTIDRHALSIALFGLDPAKSGQTAVTDKLYKLVRSAYQTVAKHYGVEAYTVQSVTWTYKALNGGKVNS